MKEKIKKMKEKIKKFLSKPGLFSKVLVIFCIAYCVRIVEWGILQFERSNTEAGTLITAGLALFGGELLLLCIKRTFAKADNRKISDIETEIDNVSSQETSNMKDLEYPQVSNEYPDDYIAG